MKIFFYIGCVGMTSMAYAGIGGDPQVCVQNELKEVKRLVDAFCPDQKVSEEDAFKSLDRVLKPYLKKTEREVSFYHYGSRGQGDEENSVNLDEVIDLRSKDGSYSGPIDLNPKDSQGRDIGKQYLKDMAHAALHSPKQAWELGRGLYTATDPLASVSYSGDPGFLLKVTVPKGMGYLDLRNDHRDLPVSKEDATFLSCYFKQQGGTANLFDRLTRDPLAFDLAIFVKSAGTQSLMQKYYDRNDIGFVAAGYGQYSYGECHLDPSQAFMTMAVFQNSSVLDRLKTEVFVPSLEKKPSKEKKKAYQEILSFFDAFDCASAGNREGNESQFCKVDQENEEKQKFDEYAKSIRAVVGKSAVTPKNRKKLTQGLFGCDETLKSEVFSVSRKKAK